MHKITLGKKDYSAPSSWNELTGEQLITWMKICAKDIKEKDALRLATICFYNINQKDFFKLNGAQEIQLLDTLTFLFDPKPKLNNWVIPVIKTLYFKKYHGPAGRFSNITIKEFRYTELLYNAYLVKQEPELLNRLIAALYRPKGKTSTDNDVRIALTDLGVSARTESVNKLSSEVKDAIVFNYEGCRNYVITRYPTIFPKSDKSQKGLSDLIVQIKEIAGGKFGNFVETERTGLYLFLDHVRDEMAENAKKK